MDAARGRGRGGVFGCLRPFAVEDDQPVSDSASFLSSGDESATKKKRRLRRSFSAALKAVIFRTALLKKSRSETRYEREFSGCGSNFSSCRGKSFGKSDRKSVSSKPLLAPESIFWSNSNHSPIFSSNSSSRTSSLSSSSRTSPARSEPDDLGRSLSIDHFGRHSNANSKQKTMRKECGRKSTYVLPGFEICVLLVCLAALIWGKAFAIVACTTAWLFFAPNERSRRRIRRVNSNEGGCDSEEYKKRVVMEGLLKRDRSRVFQY